MAENRFGWIKIDANRGVDEVRRDLIAGVVNRLEFDGLLEGGRKSPER